MTRLTDILVRACPLAALLLASSLASPSLADDDAGHCEHSSARCVATGTWDIQLALGAGLRTNPIAGADDVPLVLIPQVTYYGKRFFFDNLDLGYTLVDRRDWMVNLLITPSGDGLYFFEDDWGRFFLQGGLNTLGANFSPAPDSPTEPPAVADEDAFEGPQEDQREQESPAPANPEPTQVSPPPLRDRNIAALAGVETSGDFGRFQWQLQALSDVSGVHNGEELRFAVSTGTRRDANQLGISLGFSWKSAEVMEYYYGVTQGESSGARPAYRPGSGTAPFVRLSWNRPVNEQWRWLASRQYEHLREAVRHSPLTDQNKVMQIFVGGVYHF